MEIKTTDSFIFFSPHNDYFSNRHFFLLERYVIFSDSDIDVLSDFGYFYNCLRVVEVFSSSTAAKDRGRRFKAYRKSAAFKEYLLVAQNKPFIERFYRHDDGKWEIDDFEDLEGSIQLKSMKSDGLLKCFFGNANST